MAREYWLNLPVQDLTRARRFFTDIGFVLDDDQGAPPGMAGLRVGPQSMPIMLVQEDMFRQFAGIDAVAAGKGLLVSISVDSREEVDEIAARVEPAGGKIFGGPSDNGGMYGAGFIDIDGHRWNLLYMPGEPG